MPYRKVSKKSKVGQRVMRANNYRKRRAKNLATYRRKKVKFQNKRRPFVEIKSRSHRDLWLTLGGSSMFPSVDGVVDPTTFITLTTGETNPVTSSLLPLWSYYNPVQGISEKDMLGTTLTAKYLSAKVTFRFPATPQYKNPRYYLVHGWVTTPNNLNEFTTPTKASFTRSNLMTHVYNHLKRDFDEIGDIEFLQFKEKVNKQYKVLGFKRLQPDQRYAQLTASPVSNSLAITPSDKNITVKWALNNRKIKYTRGTNNDTVISDGIPFFYDNTGWIPFLMYYCPDSGDVNHGVTNSPQIAYNDKFWFSDS